MRVNASDGNASVEYDGDKKVITIPSKKNFFHIIFMSIWLVGWAFGMVMALGMLSNGGPVLFMTVWLTGWTCGGIFAITQILWMLFGKEIIEVDRMQIAVKKRALLYKQSREYDIKHISNFRVVESDTGVYFNRRTRREYRINGGLINFDYGMKTIKFGTNLDPAEAQHIINENFRWVDENKLG